MAFEELGAALTEEPLVLPLGGKTYTFPGDLSADSWLLIRRMGQAVRFAGGEAEPLDQKEEDLLMLEMFGDALAKMRADKRTNTEMNFVFMTLIAFHLYGRKTAELRWNQQGKTQALRRKPQDRKASVKSAQSRGSTAGTTSKPKKNPPAESPGTMSSNAGIS